MRILVYLENAVNAFNASEEQVEKLRAQLARHHVIRLASEREMLAQLPTAEVAVVWKFQSRWYALAPKLRLVCTPSAGREQIELDPEARVQAMFGAFHGRIMAESLLAMILFENRCFADALRAQSRRVWDRKIYEETRGLSRQVVLIVGFGAIGRYAARLLHACGATVHAVKRDVNVDTADADRVFEPADLLQAAALADHLVCILPGDTKTDGIIGEAVFAAMKPSACVYNLGRGNAIDVDALTLALNARRLRAAFLDVLCEEPLPSDSSLWSVPNLHLTPHASAIRADYLDLYFEELSVRLSELDAG